ncbi:MAG: hypothetical protein N2Z72_02185 [Bacteroidales bacterium]|nr:hypothetical protein [Bacteroidales bacterium]
MKKLFIIFSIVFFVGCSNPSKISTSHGKVIQYIFTSNTWEPYDRITLKFDIRDTGVFKFIGNFYVKNLFIPNRIPLAVVLQVPDGSTKYQEAILVVRENAMFRGERINNNSWKLSVELIPTVKIFYVGEHILMIYHTLPLSLDDVMEKVEVWCEKLN